MPFKLFVIGASLGGMSAMQKLLAALPVNLKAAVVLLLHRDSESDKTLVWLLQKNCALPVVEPGDKDPLLPGRVYLAPADFHLLINQESFSLSMEEPVRYARPSIDVLFESAADSFGERTTAVILSGSGNDGAIGMAAIKKNAGFTIVQDPETAECPLMPQAAIAAHAVDYIMPLDEIGPFLADIAGGRYGDSSCK